MTLGNWEYLPALMTGGKVEKMASFQLRLLNHDRIISDDLAEQRVIVTGMNRGLL